MVGIIKHGTSHNGSNHEDDVEHIAQFEVFVSFLGLSSLVTIGRDG